MEDKEQYKKWIRKFKDYIYFPIIDLDMFDNDFKEEIKRFLKHE